MVRMRIIARERESKSKSRSRIENNKDMQNGGRREKEGGPNIRTSTSPIA